MASARQGGLSNERDSICHGRNQKSLLILDHNTSFSTSIWETSFIKIQFVYSRGRWLPWKSRFLWDMGRGELLRIRKKLFSTNSLEVTFFPPARKLELVSNSFIQMSEILVLEWIKNQAITQNSHRGQVGRGGQRLSHCFFADDLILFGKTWVKRRHPLIL